MIAVKYSELLKDVASVSKAISDFTDDKFTIDEDLANKTINKKNDFNEFSRERQRSKQSGTSTACAHTASMICNL